jgi:hypothetical protein
MVTSKQLPGGAVVIRPRRGMGAGFLILLIVLLAAVIAVVGVGLFAPARLALVHEQTLGLLHGGIAATSEETYVDGCVAVAGADALQAVTRTRRVVTYRDSTTLEVVFSNRPTPTNACP